ncbi:unnamed protein product [Brassicogethes aeneus]|uniref:Uncharacterized protein n=1 Tax=Brassicogethes aeneus TaxID=1431903 RepID=A0A9P0BFK0_BRAAE|nr:unnamed protein product [Brassicogethes aeneus]
MTTPAETTNTQEANKPLLNNFEKRSSIKAPPDTTLVPDDKQKEITLKRGKSVAITEKNNVKKSKVRMVPPDGGWGWLVLFGSTLVNVLVPGTIKSFGVLFLEFLEAFNATTADGMWIPALCYFLYSSLGPVSSILSLRYSYRTVTIVGGSFAAFGMIMSFFAQSIEYLYVSFGVMVGIGAGLSFPPTVYIVTSYFVRLRGIANGICISGSALGSIILPPLLRIILNEYGYRGAVLLMGGLTLNVWVAALFYDPVENHLKPATDDEDEEQHEKPELDESEIVPAKFTISTEDSLVSLHHIPHNDSFISSNLADGTLTGTGNTFNRSVSSAAFQNIKSQMQNQHRERKISMPTGRNEVMRAKHGAVGSHSIINSSSTLHAVPEKSSNGVGAGGAMDMFSHSRLPNSRQRRGLPKRSPSTSSFQYISTPYHGSTLTLQPETFASSFSLRSIRTNKTAEAEDDQSAVHGQKKKFFDISVLSDPVYLIILISNATNAIGYTNFIILLPYYANYLNYSKDMGAYLLSIVSALDLVGRIGGSALSDITKFPKCWYFFGGLFVSGVSLFIMPFFHEYRYIAVVCGVFGLASGIYVGITAVIMADMLGEEKLQSTYGISLFVNGVLQFVGPPICGKWYDATKSFVSLFCSLGATIIAGSLIWSFMPLFINKKSKSQRDNENQRDEDDEEEDIDNN